MSKDLNFEPPQRKYPDLPDCWTKISQSALNFNFSHLKLFILYHIYIWDIFMAVGSCVKNVWPFCDDILPKIRIC